jgi:predicted RNA binding protein YcfA (HicA-like mRNA interferase family)
LARLSPLSFREVKRRLESAKFVEYSQKGSHVKFIRRTDEATDTVIVPKHGEILVGTLRSILSQAHITPQEWENLA